MHDFALVTLGVHLFDNCDLEALAEAAAARKRWEFLLTVAPARAWSKASPRDREPSMWWYRELMPVFGDEDPITLGEGFTPLMHAQTLGARLGLERLYVKDESLNPTNSFRARGQSAAVTRAKGLGVTTVSVPSAGNAGNAMAAYAARARLVAKVFLPKDVKTPFAREFQLYRADVTLVDGLITDAARVAAERGGPLGWYDVSTLKEPYRVEGKKTMGYEVAEQMDCGTALTVSDAEMVAGMIEIGSTESVSAAPEGGAALAAIRHLVEDGTIRPTEFVVLFNTGGALKYLDALPSA